MIDNEFIEESTPVFTGKSKPRVTSGEANVESLVDNSTGQGLSSPVSAVHHTVGSASQASSSELPSDYPATGELQESDASWDEEKTIIVGAVAKTESMVSLLNMVNDKETTITSFPFVIGRHRSCDLQLTHNSVSRRHAIINRQDDDTGFLLEDAGSANGTLLNGVRTDKVILNSGDKLQLGKEVFTFSVSSHEPANDALASSIRLPSFKLPRFGKSSPVDNNAASSGFKKTLATFKQKLRRSEKPDVVSSADAGASPESQRALLEDDFDSAETTVLADSTKVAVSSAGIKESLKKRLGGSRYPMLVAIAAVVLSGAYFLSPARRVVMVEQAPIVSSPALATSDERVAESNATPTSSEAGIDTKEAAPDQERSENTPAVTTADTTATSTRVPVEGTEITDTVDTRQLAAVDDRTIDTAEVAIKASATVPELQTPAQNISSAPVVDATTEDGSTTASKPTNADDVATKEDIAGLAENSVNDPVNSFADSTASSKTNTTAVGDTEVAVKPKAPIRRSARWSRGYINNSLDMYVAGDVENAVRRLGILSRSARHQKRFRDESAGLSSALDDLYSQYASGRGLLDQGQEDAAFTTWRNYLLQENRMFPQRESVFATSIKDEVVRVYTRRGNSAYAAGDPGGAYDAWQQAASISPNGEAAIALQDLQKRAKERFIEGYRQESVNIRTAMAMWQDVVQLVPSHNEYHVKAKAKLRLYKNYGAQ